MFLTDLPNSVHPMYLGDLIEWRKWRLAYYGGNKFKDRYLRRYPERESPEDFRRRRERSYNPPVTRTEIGKLKNSLVQHLAFVQRTGGPLSYQEAVAGTSYGVDKSCKSMRDFLAEDVLTEFLVMSKVGIFVDMPTNLGPTRANNTGIRPYLYAYKCEQIVNWVPDPRCPGMCTSVLLQDTSMDFDTEFDLPSRDLQTLYRHFAINAQGTVTYTVYSDPALTVITDGPRVINLAFIPFVILHLPVPIMRDVADMQIALLNLASADVNYCYRANFPLLTEQIDTRRQSQFSDTGEEESETTENLGPTYSLQYGQGMEQPDFISPPTEPLEASMSKQAVIAAQICDAIREAVCELDSKNAQAITGSLPGGLASLGSMLQRAEQQIACIWAAYEGDIDDPALIQYPETYSVQTNDERAATANVLKALIGTVPSLTCKQEIAKLIATTLLGGRVQSETISKIYKEIDSAKFFESNAADLNLDATAGLASKAFISQYGRGYPAGEADKAEVDHLKEVAAIAAAQTKNVGPHVQAGDPTINPLDQNAARGLPSHGGTGVPEKDGKPVRGAGVKTAD